MLRPDLLAWHVRTERWAAGPAMTRWVENYWMLRWSLPGDVSYSSQILPHPACSLTLEQGGQPRPEVLATGSQVVVTGVVTSRFDVDIRGRGWVFGVKFRPGGLVALTGVGPARAWADRTLPAAGIVPDEVALLTVNTALAPLVVTQAVTGVILGWVRLRTGSIAPTSLAHVIVNLASGLAMAAGVAVA